MKAQAGKIISVSLISFALFFLFNNCQKPVFTMKINSKNGTSVGNPAAPASNKILAATCQRLSECHSGLTYDACISGVMSVSGLSSQFGLPSQYDTYNTVLNGEQTGLLTGDLSRASTCSSEILSASCSDPNIQAAYVPTAAQPFSSMAQIIPKSSCALSLFVGKKIEVPIEVLDAGIASGTSDITFLRSKFNLDTNDYDGTVFYSLETVSINEDTVARKLSLLDSTGSVVAQISVPANTMNAFRQRIAFTPKTGLETYSLKVEGTTAVESFKITETRVLVDQIGASKTKIYVPLIGSYSESFSSSDSSSAAVVVSTYGGTYTRDSLHYYSLWKKNNAAFSQIATSNPYTLEVILGTADGSSDPAYASLFNHTKNLQIADSEVFTNSQSPTLLTRSFADSAAGFDDQDEMEIRIHGPVSTFAPIYKAGLWIKLENLSHAEVYYRYAKTQWVGANSGVGQTYSNMVLFDPNMFSDPVKISNEITGYQLEGGATCQNRLIDMGVQDTASSGTLVSGSELTFTNTVRTLMRSPAISINADHRFISETAANATGTSCILSQPRLVIEF